MPVLGHQERTSPAVQSVKIYWNIQWLVTVGQSFCSACVLSLKQDNPKGSHSCPRCGEMFTPKPAPRTSIKVDDLLERIKKVELSSSNHPSDPSYAGPGDVRCDECTGRKHKAVKSCLMCLASFCESHLIPHTTVPYLKRHKLIEASPDLQENICSKHEKLNEFYCRTDQKCICASCALNEHKEHDMVEAETERTGKQVRTCSCYMPDLMSSNDFWCLHQFSKVKWL